MGKWLDRARKAGGNASQSVPVSTDAPQWGAEDWQAFFDERAGIAEYDGGAPRREAERQAFEHCVARWLAMNPPAAPDGSDCAHCGKATAEMNALALALALADGSRPAWLHSACQERFRVTRRASAVSALAAFGLVEARK